MKRGQEKECLAPECFSLQLRDALRSKADLLRSRLIEDAPSPTFWVRFLRRYARTLVHSWLKEQTRFNQRMIEALEILERDCYLGAVNRELGPAGIIAAGGLWFNPPVAVELRDGQPAVARVTERIIEEGFVLSRLPRPPGRILDLGCAESTNAIRVASLGYKVTGVDLRNLPLRHPSFLMVKADLGSLPFQDNAFDVAVSLSTIEHVGLPWYGLTSRSTDHQVLAEVRRVLRPGGRLILTVPFGRLAQTALHRIYDRSALEQLLHSLQPEEIAFGIRVQEAWIFTTDVLRAEQIDSSERVSAVALVVAKKPA